LFINYRVFWEILNSDSWTNRLRITQGKLQTTFIECLKRLMAAGKIDVYESVKYTSSGNQMKKFMRRGTLTTITKQYTTKEKLSTVSILPKLRFRVAELNMNIFFYKKHTFWL